MREIKLTHGYVALVDDEDYEYINQWKWHVMLLKNLCYAKRFEWGNGKGKVKYMHRVILNASKGIEVDHIDHDGLNNQKNNIRLCTHLQNQRNRRSVNKTSKYLGVSYNKKYIVAHIRINGKYTHLGQFKTEEQAALAYNNSAIKNHGEFANLNTF